ncbi:DUF6054 family protein [Edaphobacillus lindanitolerans]|uniref:Uncharacterized protein n=1 Tax=Edaphobacillus lindanitolerans TaxID=550447 RepID=A0A1U7PSB6_9BACI|nr:DUF6054 family protein [Edaphobacillus lindanitolerans]SIT89127.1 hypothetical protein SAMN05428946_2371 [Edaphobacillus lindanitolerans]
MEKRDFYVTVDPSRAADLVMDEISRSVSGRLVDHYTRNCGHRTSVVLVMEKYFMRTGNRATLTLVADNFEGKTKVHLTGSGGGEGAFLRFDWGAGASFSETGERACTVSDPAG